MIITNFVGSLAKAVCLNYHAFALLSSVIITYMILSVMQNVPYTVSSCLSVEFLVCHLCINNILLVYTTQVNSTFCAC